MKIQRVKKRLTKAAVKVKSNYKVVLYILLGCIFAYGIIYLLTREPKMPTEFKAAIDSLTAANKALVEQQKQLDSSIHVYEAEVEKVDDQISNLKEKTTIIKEYYHEQSQQVNNYSTTQIDSFFKARYNY